MKYNAASDIEKRPMYRYRIDFSTSFTDTATYGTGRACEQYIGYPSNTHTFLPFKITNITNDRAVSVSHLDKGFQYGSIAYDEAEGGCSPACNSDDLICVEGVCVDKTGDEDCSWQRNEILQLTDIVYSTEHISGIVDILFEITPRFIVKILVPTLIPDPFCALLFKISTSSNEICPKAPKPPPVTAELPWIVVL